MSWAIWVKFAIDSCWFMINLWGKYISQKSFKQKIFEIRILMHVFPFINLVVTLYPEVSIEFLLFSDLLKEWICILSSQNIYSHSIPANSKIARKKYITSPMHAIYHKGGLGNQLFELISLIGIGRMLGREPLISATNRHILSVLEGCIFFIIPIYDSQQVWLQNLYFLDIRCFSIKFKFDIFRSLYFFNRELFIYL